VSRLLCKLVQHDTRLQTELVHVDKLAGIGTFAAGIAHDIKNSLQLILGLAENLVDEQNPAVVREHSKVIIKAVKRTSAICCDLTHYTRRSSVRGDTVVCLNGRLDEALKIARYAANFHDIDVIKEYTPGAAVLGNPAELLHIFINLIINAIHPMHHSGGRSRWRRPCPATGPMSGSPIPAAESIRTRRTKFLTRFSPPRNLEKARDSASTMSKPPSRRCTGRLPSRAKPIEAQPLRSLFLRTTHREETVLHEPSSVRSQRFITANVSSPI